MTAAVVAVVAVPAFQRDTAVPRDDPSSRTERNTGMSWTIERRGRAAVVTMTTNSVSAQNRTVA